MMEIDDNNGIEHEDISLKMLRDEERELDEFPEEDMNRRNILIYLIIGVIAIALCGISFVFGVKMGRNLERSQWVMKEETIPSSEIRHLEPLVKPDISENEDDIVRFKENEKHSTGSDKDNQMGVQEVERGSSEFMILQNAKANAKKEKDREEKPVPQTSQRISPLKVDKIEKSPARKEIRHPSLKMFTIQIAATEDKEGAEKLKDNMQKKGYDAFISSVIVSDKTFYRVRIGRYASENAALLAAENIKNKEKIGDVWVTSM